MPCYRGDAAAHAKAAWCESLHVDFQEQVAAFYFGACGFRPTPGLIHLATGSDPVSR